jgi:hypothetical protein
VTYEDGEDYKFLNPDEILNPFRDANGMACMNDSTLINIQFIIRDNSDRSKKNLKTYKSAKQFTKEIDSTIDSSGGMRFLIFAVILRKMTILIDIDGTWVYKKNDPMKVYIVEN